MATSAERHNASVIRSLSPGDIVEFPRGLYSHYGIYAGRMKIIHLTGDNDGITIGDGAGATSLFSIGGQLYDKAYVREEDFFKVAGDSIAVNGNKDDQAAPVGYGWAIVARGRSKLGEIGYNLLWKNCEHFATWCRYNQTWSDQIKDAILWGPSFFGRRLGKIIFGRYKTDN